MSADQHISLVQKLLQGDITEQESKELDQLLKTDDAAKQHLEKMQKLYGITELQKEFSENLNIDTSFEAFKKERDEEKDYTSR